MPLPKLSRSRTPARLTPTALEPSKLPQPTRAAKFWPGWKMGCARASDTAMPSAKLFVALFETADLRVDAGDVARRGKTEGRRRCAWRDRRWRWTSRWTSARLGPRGWRSRRCRHRVGVVSLPIATWLSRVVWTPWPMAVELACVARAPGRVSGSWTPFAASPDRQRSTCLPGPKRSVPMAVAFCLVLLGSPATAPSPKADELVLFAVASAPTATLDMPRANEALPTAVDCSPSALEEAPIAVPFLFAVAPWPFAVDQSPLALAL